MMPGMKTEGEKTIRLVVAEDHEQVRKTLARIINLQGEMEVVGEASDGLEALEMVAETDPDVLLVDIRMPRMDGIGVISVLRKWETDTRIIVLSAHGDEAYVSEALKNGADGYILKGLPMKGVVNAIREVNKGRSVLSPEITRPLLRHYLQADAAFAGILRTLESGKEPAEMLHECAGDVLKYFRADYGCIFSAEEGSPGRVLYSICRDDSSRPPGLAHPALAEEDFERLAGMANDAQPAVFNDFRASTGDLAPSERPVSVVVIPVRSYRQGKCYLFCYREAPLSVSSQDFRFVTLMVGQMGLLLENIRYRDRLAEAEGMIVEMRSCMLSSFITAHPVTWVTR